MRNFKKILSLVLCMAMMLSVMVVGAGAAFKDQNKIVNDEAVDMCSALNIINGYTDGSFRPEGTITRAEACKMICVALNGGKEPTLGTSASASFTDTKGHWAEGYIESCVAQGIVAGVGGGKFNPNGNVTGSQFAKMLLIALGYNATTENFTGSAWEINVNVKATAKGLYEDLETMDPSAALTRDNAAQMVWNALQAKEVKYEYTLVGTNGNLSSEITVADKNITLMADKYAAYDDESAKLTSFSYNSDKGEWTYYFAEEIGGHSSFTSSQDFTDLYMQNVKVVYTEKTNGSVDKVYGMYADDCVVLATAYVGDFDTVKSGDDEVTIADVDYDLEKTAADTNVYTFTYGKDATPATQKLNTVANAQANVAFEVVAVDYDDNGDIDFFVMYTFVVDQIASMGTKNFTLEDTAGSFKLEDVVYYDGMDEDDFVVYTPAANSATNDDTFAKVDTVLKGDITATKGDYKFAVDGTWYEATGDLDVAAGDSIKDAPVVNGYVFAATASGSADVDDYAVVTAVDSNGYGATAKLMFSDGTKKVVDTDTEYTALEGKLVYFEINSDDEYELTAATTMDIDETGFDAKAGTFNAQKDTNDSGKVKYIGGDNINDDAVIFMKDGDDYKVITGAQLKAVKGYSNTEDALIEVEIAYVNENSDTGYDSVVMAYVTAEDETVSADLIYGFVTEDPITVPNKDDKNVSQLTIWTEDGEVVLNTKYGVSVAGVKEGALIAYGVNGDNEIDELDVLTVVGVEGNEDTQAITAYDGTYIQLDNGTDRYEITSDSTIIYINVADSEGLTSGTIQKAAKTGTGDYYNNVYFIADDDEVDILFVDVNRDIDDVM